jgi:hypothetical protein
MVEHILWPFNNTAILMSPFKDTLFTNCNPVCKQAINSLCATDKEDSVYWQLTSNFSDTWWYNTLAGLSILGYSFIVLVTWFNIELQVHPLKLLFYISLADLFMIMVVFSGYKICDFNLHEFFAKTVLFSDTELSVYTALWLLNVYMNIFILFFVYVSVILNTCLAVDLVLMIKYPFKVKEKRLPRYFAVTLIISVVMTAAGMHTV